MYQMGLPPWRIDILTAITGVSFEQAWAGRTDFQTHGRTLPVLGLAELRINKAATGRPKDVLDLALLDALDTAD